jgi:hypothetical protein
MELDCRKLEDYLLEERESKVRSRGCTVNCRQETSSVQVGKVSKNLLLGIGWLGVCRVDSVGSG